jgi:hypothetical protein
MNQLTSIDSCVGTREVQGDASTVAPPFIVTPSYTEALLDPGSVFCRPDEIVEHPWFTGEEKRTILLSWARDELVLEQVANRALPELKPRSRIDAVIEALSCFDPQAAAEYYAAVGAIRAQHLRRHVPRMTSLKGRRA